MRPAVPVVLLLAAASGGGCRQLFGIDDTQVARDGGTDDAPPGTPDAPIDAIPPPDAGACPPPGMLYGTGPVKICIAGPLVGTIGVPNLQTFDTTASTTCLAGQPPEYCVIAAADLVIDLGGYLRLVGTRPLVVVAQRIEIAGTLDAGSRSNFNPGGLQVGIGPGANPAACDPGVQPTLPIDIGGGGAGGSFGGRGGAGGLDSTGGTGGGVAGMPMPAISTARGGCAGQDGAGPDNGEGGAGGGAVYLIATERIEVVIGARIIASGSGAQGGHRNNGINTGGGGGGSGGLIALDAPLVRNDGSIFTNGGGGGEGGRNGGDGGNSMFPTVAASGGFGGGGGQGGEGGAGTAGTNLDGEDGMPGGGADSAGGGGGGGAGVIKVYSPGGLQGNGGVESPPAM